MPHLTNPFGSRLFCARLERIIAPGETVEITEAEAADLEDGSVFRVHRPAERETVTRGSKRVEASSTPKRATVNRGAKQVEVTRAPDVETRG